MGRQSDLLTIAGKIGSGRRAAISINEVERQRVALSKTVGRKPRRFW
jgi:hypothetical protein